MCFHGGRKVPGGHWAPAATSYIVWPTGVGYFVCAMQMSKYLHTVLRHFTTVAFIYFEIATSCGGDANYKLIRCAQYTAHAQVFSEKNHKKKSFQPYAIDAFTSHRYCCDVLSNTV
ncbi:hypothetical protein EVAR_12485_1 [Eumeta japonica]|uniref:Uncharacterized protein n=1 Tax=Eumeta variegata TaxID=151549 RepID=A0A4C1TPI7_EUMVA|nr:hypothetical protein EVAR_12485_1 [Eumeta japonica]